MGFGNFLKVDFFCKVGYGNFLKVNFLGKLGLWQFFLYLTHSGSQQLLPVLSLCIEPVTLSWPCPPWPLVTVSLGHGEYLQGVHPYQIRKNILSRQKMSKSAQKTNKQLFSTDWLKLCCSARCHPKKTRFFSLFSPVTVAWRSHFFGWTRLVGHGSFMHLTDDVGLDFCYEKLNIVQWLTAKPPPPIPTQGASSRKAQANFLVQETVLCLELSSCC